MEKGDIIIDGGNSYFVDTERREKALKAEGLTLSAPAFRGEGRAMGSIINAGRRPQRLRAACPIWEAIAQG